MVQKARILIVDDESSMREMISILLRRHGFEVKTAASARETAQLLDAGAQFDLVVTDLVMDHGGGIEVLAEFKTRRLNANVIVITAFGSAETAVEAMKMGAFDYIAKPFNVDEFMIIVHQALEHQALVRENIDLRARVRGEYRFADIVGRSEAILNVIELCRKVADSTTTVLISGESGTGKEIVARALHFSGGRAKQPFVAVNCGALPEQLMESELFGHEKGAFTGAVSAKEGLLQAADGGTVFLDEVGELPLPLQVKLLRVLQDRMVRPVGSSRETPVDIRVIAATNRDLTEQVARQAFRTDLYYRLNVISVRLPPLRQRREDIPLLVEHLLERLAAERGATSPALSPEALRVLLEYNYPGNVRELANILERAATLATGDQILPSDFPPELDSAGDQVRKKLITLPPDGLNLDSAMESFEQNLIDQALDRTGGVRKQAAELLGISFRSFRYRLNKIDGKSEKKDDE